MNDNSTKFIRPVYTFNPRLSIHISNNEMDEKSKLQIYKKHLMNIKSRKASIPYVPQPSIVQLFKQLKLKKEYSEKKQYFKKQIKIKTLQLIKLQKQLNRYKQIYDSRQDSSKQKNLLAKILSSKLESQFDKTKDKFKELQFNKIICNANKKLYFYQLGEVFFNINARNIFSIQELTKNVDQKLAICFQEQTKNVDQQLAICFQKQTKNVDQQLAICFGYLSFIIQRVAKIAGVQTWIQFKFKGPNSTITINDPKLMQQNGNRQTVKQTFILHPRQPRLKQALVLVAQQLKQIMKYHLGIHVPKSSNFYELCEILSIFLLNL